MDEISRLTGDCLAESCVLRLRSTRGGSQDSILQNQHCPMWSTGSARPQTLCHNRGQRAAPSLVPDHPDLYRA
jgi:hypothetical protein